MDKKIFVIGFFIIAVVFLSGCLDHNPVSSYQNNYISVYYHNHDGISIDFVEGVEYNLFFNATYENNNCFLNSDMQNISVNVSGLYLCNFWASGDGQNNHEYRLSIGVNGVLQDCCEVHKKLSAGNDIVTMSGSCFLRINSGDKLTLVVKDAYGGGDGKYYASNFNLVWVDN